MDLISPYITFIRRNRVGGFYNRDVVLTQTCAAVAEPITGIVILIWPRAGPHTWHFFNEQQDEI